MNDQRQQLWNELPTWAQAVLVAGVVVLISFMFPTGVKFDYSYERGQRWRYDDLIAPFDFPILKSNEELDQERRRIRENASPYFVFEHVVAARELAGFEAAFQTQFQSLDDDVAFADLRRRPNRYLALGRGLLTRCYERGIVEPSASLSTTPTGSINILRGSEVKPKAPSQLVLPAEVIGYLPDSLRRLRLRDAPFLLPLLQDAVAPNIAYSDSLTKRFVEADLGQVLTSRGMVRQGELIVTNDGVITEDVLRRLISFETQYEAEVVDESRGWFMFAGYLLLTSIIMSVLLLYIRVFHRREFSRFNRLAFILLLVLASSFAVFRIDSVNALSIYLMPFAIIPIIIRAFYPLGVALFTHIVVVLIASFLSSLGYEFTFLQIMIGIVAVLSPTGSRDWGEILKSLLLIAATYSLGFIGLELIQEGNWRIIDWTVLTWLGLNVFLTLLAYPLIPLLGKLFGFLSEVVLQELGDVNRPVLQELGLRAPGTLQHSLAVSNLAEAAVREIGGNTLLVKVAALYHDIGKTVEPLYFIENQSGRNPHDDLTERQSAEVIISHVAKGIQLAKQAKLPKEIIEFIKTHHGTTRVEYFYRTYLKNHPEAEASVEEDTFRYPGPLPTTKEQGVMMLADGVEAAGRALRDPTSESIDALVDGILEAKISGGQLSTCALSFADLETCRALFKRMLKGMYHARVEYPDDQEATSEG